MEKEKFIQTQLIEEEEKIKHRMTGIKGFIQDIEDSFEKIDMLKELLRERIKPFKFEVDNEE